MTRLYPKIACRTIPCLVVAVASFSTAPTLAQEKDVTFFVVGKHGNVQQFDDGTQAAVDFSFFAEVFMTADGDARDGSLTYPTGERVAFEDMRQADAAKQDNILLISGADRFTDFPALQARYPDGNYEIAFKTSDANVATTLTFEPRPMPRAPVINVKQDALGRCVHVAPGRDVTIAWESFAEGRDDPHDILDDLVFVILEDADGVRVAHSGRPFEAGTFLTHNNNQHTIPGNVLKPNASYTLSVEHALLDDTRLVAGVPAFTTRAVTTKLSLTTAASISARGDCSDSARLPPIDDHITMLYYDDIGDAATFYGEILGLNKDFDWDWVKFYRTSTNARIGIVNAGEGAYHEPQDRNAVMVSLVTADVDAWFERIEKQPGVRILKPVSDGGGIRSFLLEDPGGYTVEFFQWLDAAQ